MQRVRGASFGAPLATSQAKMVTVSLTFLDAIVLLADKALNEKSGRKSC